MTLKREIKFQSFRSLKPFGRNRWHGATSIGFGTKPYITQVTSGGRPNASWAPHPSASAESTCMPVPCAVRPTAELAAELRSLGEDPALGVAARSLSPLLSRSTRRNQRASYAPLGWDWTQPSQPRLCKEHPPLPSSLIPVGKANARADRLSVRARKRRRKKKNVSGQAHRRHRQRAGNRDGGAAGDRHPHQQPRPRRRGGQPVVLGPLRLLRRLRPL